VLLHVSDPGTHDIAHGSFAGLLGRGHSERDPVIAVEQLGAASASGMSEPAALSVRSSRPSRTPTC
jgi:hypothetical protein